MTIAVNRNLSNCEISPKKSFSGLQRDSNPFALQCSTRLSYEDPYTEGQPIYWVHQPVKGMKHRMIWCELREYKWNEYVTIAVNRNLCNCENSPKKGLSGLHVNRLQAVWPCVPAETRRFNNWRWYVLQEAAIRASCFSTVLSIIKYLAMDIIGILPSHRIVRRSRTRFATTKTQGLPVLWVCYTKQFFRAEVTYVAETKCLKKFRNKCCVCGQTG